MITVEYMKNVYMENTISFESAGKRVTATITQPENRLKEDEKMNHDIETVQINEKLSVRNGIASTVITNIAANYFPLFAISVLGATNYQVSLITSLPQFIGMFAMVVGSIIVNQIAEKKKFTSYSIFFQRIFFLGIFLVMYIPAEYRGWVFVILIGLANLPGSFAFLSWQSLIGDLIPDERRSGFFSHRNRVLTIVGMITTFSFGVLLQQFDKTNPYPYQFLFFLALMLGMVEVYYMSKHIEVKKEKKRSVKKFSFGWHVFKQKRFMYFVITALVFNFAWQMAWSLFSIYQIKYAMATGLWVSIFAVANQIAQIVSFKWWGRMADKHSNAKMMILVSVGMATAPVLNILSTNLIYLTIVNGLSGLFVSGTVLLLFNQLLEVTNEENRSNCISNYNILLALVAFIAPQFGVFLLEQTSMDVAMITSTILRLASAFVFMAFYMYLRKGKTLVTTLKY